MKRLGAYPVYLIFSGGTSLFFALVFTVNLVYHVTTVGLNPLQLVLVGTLLEATALLFEVPTGVVADLYSRRLSVIIGTALVGVGFVIEGAYPSYANLMVAQVVWGIGATFISGAADAWIADEMGPEAAGRAYLRAAQIGQVTGLVGIGLSAVLGSFQIALPIVLGGGLFVLLAGFLALFMPEEGFRPAPPEARRSWRGLTGTLREGGRLVRARPVLVIVLFISLLYGMFSEGVDRLWTAHILENFTLPPLGALEPVVWFGIINAVGMALSIATTEVAQRRLDLGDQAVVTRALAALFALIMVGVVVFALAGSFALALAALWVSKALRATSGPILTAWTNRHVDSSVRATVLSMSAQVNAIGQIAGGPVVGWVGTAHSLRAALAAAGLALLPVPWLLRGRGARREKEAASSPAG